MSKPWLDYFPYDSPRSSQDDAMEQIHTMINNNGVVLMEGACGTGKTLSALTPAIHNINEHSSEAKQVIAVTSVKQQMRAFQEEIKRINNNGHEISAITLVSATDLHPYIKYNIIEDQSYQKINQLRENTRALTDDIYGYTFESLYNDAVDTNSDGYYGQRVPTKEGLDYDPYYAKYRADYDADEDNSQEVIPFNTDDIGVLTVDRIVDLCAQHGYCPHSISRLALEHVDVVIGNYMHLFDPKTVSRFTEPIINDDRVVIFDEAHNLLPRVRDVLSYDISYTSLEESRQELQEALVLLRIARSERQSTLVSKIKNDTLDDTNDFHSEIKTALTNDNSVTNANTLDEAIDSVGEIANQNRVTIEMLEQYISFLEFVQDRFDKLLQKEGFENDKEIPLRDPDTIKNDVLKNQIKLAEYVGVPEKGQMIGAFCYQLRQDISESNSVRTTSKTVTEFLSKWDQYDNTKYFRSVELSSRSKPSGYETKQWEDKWIATLNIKNCMPTTQIAERVDQMHSAIFMSATLEPLDIYGKTVGVSQTEKPVKQLQYGLEFPKENRLTLGVETNKFTYSNREQPFNYFGPNTDNQTRKQYRDVIVSTVKNTHGNTLITMPSYDEAEWAGEILKSKNFVDQSDIIIDKSSSYQETEHTKERFFRKDNGVLITAARGTLVEGIDYIGDRLHSVLVCGVPITNTNSPYKNAIKTAYENSFTEYDGFTLAFTVPAVRKTRQAIGRVIRTNDDKGIRIMADSRYLSEDGWSGVKQYLGHERDELESITVDKLDQKLQQFWD